MMPEQSRARGPIRFGRFELSAETGELRKDGIRLKLSGQSIQVLVMLAATPGNLVTREELQHELWPGATFGDPEHGLNAAVNRLRETLGDSATEPMYIETVPGRGYRFIASLLFPDRDSEPGKVLFHDFSKRVPAGLNRLASETLPHHSLVPRSQQSTTPTTVALDIPRFTREFIDGKQKWEALKGHIAFGRYVLNDLIGCGGTGAVFRSRDLAVGREVAIKVFYAVPHSHIGYLQEATTRSIRGLASLSHPNLQQILDYGVHRTAGADASFFVVGEFIRGQTLEKTLKTPSGDKQLFSGGETVVADSSTLLHKILLARQVAAGLHAAHSATFVGGSGFQEHGICHGDITPRNILVEENDRAVIIDFMIPDLQRLVGSDEETSSVQDATYGWQFSDGRYIYLYPPTGMYGTPGFMPPEQQAEGIVTPVSDIYTLGLTLALLFFSYEFLKSSWPGFSELACGPVQWGFTKAASKLPMSNLRDFYLEVASMLEGMTKIYPKSRLQNVQTVDRHLARIEQECRNAIAL